MLKIPLFVLTHLECLFSLITDDILLCFKNSEPGMVTKTYWIYKTPFCTQVMNRFYMFYKYDKRTLKEAYIRFLVAGSTSLSLLLVRLIVSRFLIPEMDETTEVLRKEEGKEAGEDREKMLGNYNRNIAPLRSRNLLPLSPAVQWTVHALRIYDSLASIFSTCWLIVGSVYVYGKHSSVTFGNPKEATYCDYNAYTFAFVVITIGFVSLGLSILAALCACCFKRE